GVIKENAGLTAHFWLGDYDAQVVPDAAGNFQQIIPKNVIVYQHEAGNHFPADYPLRLQLLDATGQTQSGISRLYFGSGCAVYVEYWRENWSGLKIGSRAARPPAWAGPYELAFSEFTTSSLVICEFSGFIGTAYDDYGPMHDVYIQIANVDQGLNNPEYLITEAGTLDVQMGPSGWYLFADPDHRYLLQVANANGDIYFSDVIYLPPKQGCEKNLIKVSITQSEGRDDPPPLPAGWGKS
ncbi:MAG TPA: hypothetical protein VHO69_12410, partial [Phototrophicaceae bacterium]|nr:hypothetical protein [Phototrophicaceae bacterium]